MDVENRQCQYCKNHFTIEPEDFDYYELLDLPLPDLCPKCE